MKIIEASDNALVKAAVTEITKEERLHAGRFLDTFSLAPEERTLLTKGI